MMKRSLLLLAALVVFAFASCQKMTDEPLAIAGGDGDIFEATTESSLTKTALMGNDTEGYDVVWSSGDEITIGGYAGCLYRLLSGAGTTSATFSNISGKTLADGEYDSYYRMYSNTLPQEQKYYPDGKIPYAPMHARVTVLGGKPQSAVYHNLCGLLRLTLKRSQAVSVNVAKITVSADQPLCGEFDIVDYAAVMRTGGATEISLDCTYSVGESGVELTPGGVDFYIALPAGSYTNVKVTVTDKNGSTCTKSLGNGKTLDIVRSEITPASFTVEKFIPAALEPVDMGTSVLWANMNISAITPNSEGQYFAWGETAWKSRDTYTISNYFDTDDEGATFKKYNRNGGKTVLDPEDDAAHVWWGGDWRMPTKAEWQELVDNCDMKHLSLPIQEKIGGVVCYNGLKMTSKTTGNSIFLKESLATISDVQDLGNYWSSTLDGDSSSRFGTHFTFYFNGPIYNQHINGYSRELDGLIRPVCPKPAAE